MIFLCPQQDLYEIQTYLDGSVLTLYDHPWPGLTPDLLSVLLVVATQAKGSVLIHQKMFESRLFFVDKLLDMGAQIILCDPHRAAVIGLGRAQQLRGITHEQSGYPGGCFPADCSHECRREKRDSEY